MNYFYKSFTAGLVALSLGLGGFSASAKGLADFEGSYTGLLLYSQGEDVRIIGTTTVKVVKSGKILFKGRIGENDFRSRVVLNGRRFVMSSLLPGQFKQRVVGKAKIAQKFLEFSADFVGEVSGSGKWRLEFDSFGSILTFSGVINLTNGTPVYVNFTAG